MKLPFIIYAQALGIYLLATLPCVFFSVVYVISAALAILFGFAAMLLFALVFFILRTAKPTATVVTAVLFVSVIAAVAVSYKILLWQTDIDPGRSFWAIDGFTLFPVAAVLSGWAAIGINSGKINGQFSQPVIEDFETIFS